MGGADFSISNMNDNSNYTFSIDELNNIKSTAGVTETTGTILLLSMVYKNLSDQEVTSTTCFIGFKGSNIVNTSLVPGVGNIELIKGRLINEKSHEVVVTKSYSEMLNLEIGDNITIYHPRSRVQYLKEDGSQGQDQYDKSRNVDFTVVGIVDSLDTGREFMRRATRLDGIISLDVANELIYNSSDLKFDFINVKTDPKQLNHVKNTINQSNPNYEVWDEKSSNGITDSALQLVLLFLFIGCLLLLVATLKSISERIRELGVLKALGWSNKRIIAMLFMETTIQTVIAGIIASIIIVINMIISSDLGFTYLIENFLYIIGILVVTLVISLIMPIIGTLLPALYIIRLKPTEALKYE